MTMLTLHQAIASALAVLLTAGVATAARPRELQDEVEQTVAAPVRTPLFEPASDDRVSLSRGSHHFWHARYEQRADGRLESGGDERETGGALVEELLDTWVIENRFLRATLLPGYGGRILSLVNKTTGRETLYRNPVAVPYGVGEGNFHFDWLQIVGGIFPTLGPEHGKTWNQPWSLVVEQQTPQAVTLRMRFADIIGTRTPARFATYRGASGAQLDYRVTLRAGRAALDTEMTLTNPGPQALRYEYWTNVGLAPGSPPEAPVAGPEVEIVAPVHYLSSSWCLSEPRCSATAAVETPTQRQGVFAFDKLRWFRNWAQWGIFYAEPDMRGANFWGAINHANGDGLMRVADNHVTRGFKLWTFGRDSAKVDPLTSRDPARPFIELWGGTSTEFFRPGVLEPGGVVRLKEVYAPTMGLSTATHANDNFIAHVWVQDGHLSARVTSVYPEAALRFEAFQNGRVIGAGELAPSRKSALAANVAFDAVEGGHLLFRLKAADDHTVFEAGVPAGR